MCRRSYNRNTDIIPVGKKKQDIKHYQFYAHLRAYLLVNILLAALALEGNNPFAFGPLIFFWGLGVLSHYKKTFYSRSQISSKNEEQSDIVELIEESSKWNDKDLV